MSLEDEIDRGDAVEETPEEETTEEVLQEEEAAPAPDEPAQTEPEPDESDQDQEPMLPKSRYDSVQARNRALQDRIEQMEFDRETALENSKQAQAQAQAQQAQAQSKPEIPPDPLAELDNKITDALLDGDKELASKYRREQRSLERDFFQQELQASTQRATSQARDQVRLDTTVDFLEATYTELNPHADSFSQETVDELEDLRHAFESTRGYSSDQALLKAAKYMFPNVPVPDTPQAPSKAGALKKAVKASQSQPPDLKKTGQDASTGG
ncbi:MAG: hypothetical protein DRI46_14460, partial [Chloroflexi bacterium]